MNISKLFYLLNELKKYHKITNNWWQANSNFEIMLGAILCQNTSWNNARQAIKRILLADAMNAEEILTISQSQLRYLVRPAGFFKQKSEYIRIFCWWYLLHGGYKKLERMQTEDLRAALLQLKGIGPETADDIILYAFKRPAFIVDTYARRLFKRLGLINGNEKYQELRLAIERQLPQRYEDLYMAHAAIVEHSKTYCTKTPNCQSCPLANSCQQAATSVQN